MCDISHDIFNCWKRLSSDRAVQKTRIEINDFTHMRAAHDAPSEIINSPRQLCQYSIVFFSLADRLQALSLGVIRARARNRKLI